MKGLRGSVPFLISAVFSLLAPASVGAAPADGNLSAAADGSDKVIDDLMSPAGQAASRHAIGVTSSLEAEARAALSALEGQDPSAQADEDDAFARGGQAELSIAVDTTGQHVVIGFNDTRGFQLSPVSVSGFMYSDDGGRTFVDGGQLPSPGTDLVGATRLPSVFGDPEVKYLGDCTFLYASIVVAKFSETATVQTMGVHRSTDCGHTWAGPFVIPSASNPNGLLSPTGAPRDAADKEFLDVDADTGRVLMSWSNFTPAAPGGVEISATFSDDILADLPSWSPRAVVAAEPIDGQSSVPRFAGRGAADAYVTWRRFPSGLTNTIGFAHSSDNGATWSPPISVPADFFTIDQILGNDRVNTSPSMAVDRSAGAGSGNVYLVYADNDSGDGSDIAFQRSTDRGASFSAPVFLNSRPGDDRAQWFPWVTVDPGSGRVYVFYYDQGIATTGDLTQVSYTFSQDGGAHWSRPVPLTARPFHAGHGNDTGQPNIGDYNQAVAQGGELFAAWSQTSPVGFADGQPDSASFTTPDAVLGRVNPLSPRLASVSLGAVTAAPGAGDANLDPGELVSVRMPLRNDVTNAISAGPVRAALGILSTPTPGVLVVAPLGSYGTIQAGQTRQQAVPFLLFLRSDFVPGTDIELELRVTTLDGSAVLRHTVHTGTPVATTLFSENFDGVAAGALPGGWLAVHQGGANTVPWTTSTGFCGQGNAAFHPNAEDGAPSPVRFERLFSPAFDVPAGSDFVTIEFDVCYDTEEDPNFNILAYDGFLLRIADLTPGRILRSALIEAFATEITTGSILHFPRHFPRSGNAAYFQDMSAWAGDSGGVQHVRMRLPGMAGSTAQLRFEYTQDGGGTCLDLRPDSSCGVSVDNIVIRSVDLVAPPRRR
jgi:hypothetical protein